jgi:hypothetical protein
MNVSKIYINWLNFGFVKVTKTFAGQKVANLKQVFEIYYKIRDNLTSCWIKANKEIFVP